MQYVRMTSKRGGAVSHDFAYLFSHTINIPKEYGKWLKRTHTIDKAISFECENGLYLWWPKSRGAQAMKARGIGARNLALRRRREQQDGT